MAVVDVSHVQNLLELKMEILDVKKMNVLLIKL